MSIQSATASAMNSFSGILGKRKELEESEQKEAFTSLHSEFDITVLCETIIMNLKCKCTPIEIVDKITQLSSKILLELASQQKIQLLKNFNLYVTIYEPSKSLQKLLKDTLLILYSNSLMNSKYRAVVAQLDKEIDSHLKAITNEAIANLQTAAEQSLDSQPILDLTAMKNKIAEIKTISSAINDVLNLFYYLDPENQEKIINIYSYAKNNNIPMFPKCKIKFSELLSSLRTIKYLQPKLVHLKCELLAKQKWLEQQMADISPTRNQHLPESVKFFFDHQAQLIWDTGCELLKKSIQESDKEKEKPQDFIDAITTVSKDLRSNALSAPFIMGVCVTYFNNNEINDIADFMQTIISQLPSNECEKLITKLKNSQNKQPVFLETLEEYLKTQFDGPITLIKLKSWMEKTL